MATAMMGLVLTAIFGLQSIIIERDSYHAQRLERMFLITNVLADPQSAKPIKEKGLDKKLQEAQEKIKLSYDVQEPPTVVTFERAPLKNKRFEAFKNIQQITCSFSWQGMYGQEKDQLVALFFKLPEQKQGAS